MEPAIPCIGIPYCNRYDLLLRCVRSIDLPVKQIVIVDQCIEPLTNAQRQELRAACAERGPLRFSRHRNTGCAGAWNEIIQSTPAPYWLLVNNDIELAPGDLATMRDFLAATPQQAAVYGNHGASWWAVTAWGVQWVGLFDENLWPAYLEDCDWSRRCDLLELPRASLRAKTHSIHGDAEHAGSCTLNADPSIRSAIAWCHGQNHTYYARKWGGRNGSETFRHPFNDPQWPIWAWRFEPAWRAHLMAKARACT